MNVYMCTFSVIQAVFSSFLFWPGQKAGFLAKAIVWRILPFLSCLLSLSAFSIIFQIETSCPNLSILSGRQHSPSSTALKEVQPGLTDRAFRFSS